VVDVTIYFRPSCPYCQKALKLLQRKEAVIHKIDITDRSDLRDQMIEKSNNRTTVPQIFIGSFHVGGCDDLYELDYDHKLDALLKGETP
jgi:glutaredoxin 3